MTLRDKSRSSVTGGSSGAGVIGRGALHLERFRPVSVPQNLRGSSGAEALIVRSLDSGALQLEINLALHLELLRALRLELRGRDRLRLERVR